MGLFFRQSQSRFFQYRRPCEMQVLLEMADAIVSWDRYLSGVGLFLPQDESEKSCFAVAVASDQAQTFTGIHLKTDVREKLAREI
jgi:hypothetical protein